MPLRDGPSAHGEWSWSTGTERGESPPRPFVSPQSPALDSVALLHEAANILAAVELIGRHTDPQIVLERITRYRFAAPLIAGARTWCDLAAGDGMAAAQALPSRVPEHTLLVDGDAAALEWAARELKALRPETLRADLAAPGDFERLEERLRTLGEPGPRCLTAFDLIERLSSLEPVVGGLVSLGTRGWDVILSVPNDAFRAREDPLHATSWSPGAVEELRSLLPAGSVVACQRQLSGSRIDAHADRGRGVDLRASLAAADDESAATHFLIAFGPRASQLASVAAIADADLAERRAWERQREARLAYLERIVSHQTTRI